MDSRFQRNQKVEIAPMKNETVLFNPQNNKFCLLNHTAACVWQQLEQPRTVAELVQALQNNFSGVEAAQAEKDVQKVLQDLTQVECVIQP